MGKYRTMEHPGPQESPNPKRLRVGEPADVDLSEASADSPSETSTNASLFGASAAPCEDWRAQMQSYQPAGSLNISWIRFPSLDI